MGKWRTRMENLVSPSIWAGKTVFVTGHTGFTGAWLVHWLDRLGAEVHGYSRPPPTEPSLFELSNVAAVLSSHTVGDVEDLPSLKSAVMACEPDVVIHLAAQALVSESYARPVQTLKTNVMGTCHLLESVRQCPGVASVVIVTSDKCYQNNNQGHAFIESDKLGGGDVYSASKACAELVTTAYATSFFNAGGHTSIATARAGNIIGGGDWSADRLIPDCVRALAQDQPVVLRQPAAIRPWQHVLDAVSGYLQVAAAGWAGPSAEPQAWNLGPSPEHLTTVQEMAAGFMERFGGRVQVSDDPEPFKEAQTLTISPEKARRELGWHPRWDLEAVLTATSDWYEAWRSGQDVTAVTQQQISTYMSDHGFE